MNHYAGIMTDAEKQERVGVLAEKLSQCVAALNRVQREAHDLALSLRIIADCFDSECPEVSVLDIHKENEFTFTDRRIKADKHAFPTSQQRLHPDKQPLVSVPDGGKLIDLMGQIHALSREADDLNKRLRTEGIDLTEINKTLRIVA